MRSIPWPGSPSTTWCASSMCALLARGPLAPIHTVPRDPAGVACESIERLETARLPGSPRTNRAVGPHRDGMGVHSVYLIGGEVEMNPRNGRKGFAGAAPASLAAVLVLTSFLLAP